MEGDGAGLYGTSRNGTERDETGQRVRNVAVMEGTGQREERGGTGWNKTVQNRLERIGTSRNRTERDGTGQRGTERDRRRNGTKRDETVRYRKGRDGLKREGRNGT